MTSVVSEKLRRQRASWPPNWRPGFQNPEDLRGVVKISSLRKKKADV